MLKKSGENSSLRLPIWPALVGLAIRFLVLVLVYPQFLDPGRDHWEFGYEIGKIAASLARGHGFGNPYWTQTGPTALLTPVYPYVLSYIFRIFGTYSKSSAVVFVGFNCVLSAITCIPIFFIARRSFDTRVARFAVWIWAFHPYAIDFSATTMWYHSCVALLLSLLFWAALRLRCSERKLAWSCFGLLWGFAALVDPVVLGTMPFLSSWCCCHLRFNGHNRKRAFILVILGTSVPIAPWLVRNYRVFHQPVFLKDGIWMEVCVGNLGNTLHWWNDDCQPSGRRTSDARNEFARVGEMAFLQNRKAQALAAFKAKPLVFLIRSIRRVAFYWTGFWSFDPVYLREEPLDPANIFFLTCYSLLTLLGLLVLYARDPALIVPYVIVLVTFPLIYYLTHVDPGYRHPLDPLMTILSAGAISRWRDIRVLRRRAECQAVSAEPALFDAI